MKNNDMKKTLKLFEALEQPKSTVEPPGRMPASPKNAFKPFALSKKERDFLMDVLQAELEAAADFDDQPKARFIDKLMQRLHNIR